LIFGPIRRNRRWAQNTAYREGIRVHNQRWVGIFVCFLVTAWLAGCQCGAPDDEAAGSEATPAIPATDTGDAGVTDDGSGVSAEVQALIAAGDAAAIAGDMGARATELRALVAATEKSAVGLEGSAEGMTGRETPVDPRDPAVVESLIASASALAEGADALAGDVEKARQLVTDLQAEAEALYGRPVPPAEPVPELSHSNPAPAPAGAAGSAAPSP